MNNCGTCKYWESNARSMFLPDFGKCHGIEMNYDHTEWTDKRSTAQLKEGSKHILAFVEDGSDYYAALICKKEFGCAMHREGKWNETI